MQLNILKQFYQNGGYFHSSDINTRSEKYQLQLAMQKGIISRVKRGLYRLNNISSAYQELEVANIVPPGIFCMFTAWAHYDLTTHISSEYHIAVPKSFRIRIPEYPPVKLYFWVYSTFELGLSQVIINESQVKMYDLERSVCDAVKFRNKIGPDMLGEILRNYIKRSDKDIDKLLKYSSDLRISKILNQLLQVLL